MTDAETGRSHSLLGLRVDTDLTAMSGLEVIEGPADLTVRILEEPPTATTGSSPQSVCWKSPERGPSGGPETVLERRGPWWVLCFDGVGEFFVDGGRVVAVPATWAAAELVELRLLGPVLAFCLELRGVVTLHASAVVVDGRGVGFLATHGGGKTSLAAALMQQGASLLTDDLLALEVTDGGVRAHPGYPQMRMWPAAAGHFAGGADRWPRVLPQLGKRRVAVGGDGIGRFHPRPSRLEALIVPERRRGAAAVELERLPPGDALMQLVRGSYLPRLAAGAGLQPRRLAALARLAEAVPVHRLRYPSGYARLAAVAGEVRHCILSTQT